MLFTREEWTRLQMRVNSCLYHLYVRSKIEYWTFTQSPHSGFQLIHAIYDISFLLIHERETRNEGVLELYGILLAVMCYVLAAPSSQFSGIYPPFSLRYSHKNRHAEHA